MIVCGSYADSWCNAIEDVIIGIILDDDAKDCDRIEAVKVLLEFTYRCP